MRKKTLHDSDILSDSVSEKKDVSKLQGTRVKFNTVLFALAIGGTVMTGCSDEKSCSDSDTGADGNGSTAYDTGTYQDSYDYGGDTDTGSADPVGNGDLCRDYD